jgi:hypothetical protein
MLDLNHLVNDGSPLIRLTCSGGSLDITWVGMQIQTAVGYYDPDDGFAWSANQAPSTQEPAMNGFGTYATYMDGSTRRWTVDDTAVQAVAPTSGGGPGYDVWTGAGGSHIDAQDARDASIADFGPDTTVGDTGAFADLVFSGPGFMDPFDHWDAVLREQVTTFSAPTEALLPGTPDGYFTIPPYLRQGFDTYEWLDDDRHLMGWRMSGGNVEFSGDTDTLTLLLTEVVDGFDTSSEWYTGGTSFLEATPGDVDPFGDPDLVPIPDSFLTSSSQLIARRVTLGRETTDQLSFWTEENGYAANNSGTSAFVASNTVRARFRIPGWRYKIPTFVSTPGPPPVIDFDEDPRGTYLRNRQRNDGLGGWSTPRAKGTSSRQLSLHNRGYE